MTRRLQERLITVNRNGTDSAMINRKTTKKQKWEGKQFYRHFMRQISEISHKKCRKWLRKENFKRDAESLLIAVQNSAITRCYFKAKIDEMKQNRYCRLCGDFDETINHLTIEWGKLAQKMTWVVGQGDSLAILHETDIWQFYKIVYAHTRIYPREKDGKILWDFGIQARRPRNQKVYNQQNSELYRPGRLQSKNQRKLKVG